MFLGRKKPLRDPRRGQAPCTPAFLDQDRSSVLLGRGASALRNLVCLRPPVAKLYLSASGDRGIPDGLRATRKPRPLSRNDGTSPDRTADRQNAAV